MRNSKINPKGVFIIEEVNLKEEQSIIYRFAYYNSRLVYIHSEYGEKQKCRNENIEAIIRSQKLQFKKSNIEKHELLNDCKYIVII